MLHVSDHFNVDAHLCLNGVLQIKQFDQYHVNHEDDG